jgi:hypothetical protein
MYHIELYNEIPNFISTEESKSLIKFFNNYEYKIINGMYGYYADGQPLPNYSNNRGKDKDWNNTIKDDIISDSITWKKNCETYDLENDTVKLILNRLLEHYRKFNSKYKNDYISITRLGERSYIIPHKDISFEMDSIPEQSAITSIIYLSLPKQGGELVLNDNVIYKPVLYSLVEFNGRLTQHEVKKILKGDRYTYIAGFSLKE